MFGLFADSLPDGWGRLLIDRHLMSQGVDFRSITPLVSLSFTRVANNASEAVESAISDVQKYTIR